MVRYKHGSLPYMHIPNNLDWDLQLVRHPAYTLALCRVDAGM